jgi:hypothetical protein
MEEVEVVSHNNSGLHLIIRINNGHFHHTLISISSGTPHRGNHGLRHPVRIRPPAIQTNNPVFLVRSRHIKLMSQVLPPHIPQQIFKLPCILSLFLLQMISGIWTRALPLI